MCVHFCCTTSYFAPSISILCCTGKYGPFCLCRRHLGKTCSEFVCVCAYACVSSWLRPLGPSINTNMFLMSFKAALGGSRRFYLFFSLSLRYFSNIHYLLSPPLAVSFGIFYSVISPCSIRLMCDVKMVFWFPWIRPPSKCDLFDGIRVCVSCMPQHKEIVCVCVNLVLCINQTLWQCFPSLSWLYLSLLLPYPPLSVSSLPAAFLSSAYITCCLVPYSFSICLLLFIPPVLLLLVPRLPSDRFSLNPPTVISTGRPSMRIQCWRQRGAGSWNSSSLCPKASSHLKVSATSEVRSQAPTKGVISFLSIHAHDWDVCYMSLMYVCETVSVFIPVLATVLDVACYCFIIC